MKKYKVEVHYFSSELGEYFKKVFELKSYAMVQEVFDKAETERAKLTTEKGIVKVVAVRLLPCS